MAIKTEEKIEAVEVDINDTSLAEGQEQELDLKDDWQAKAAPPPKGRYKFRLFIEDEKVEQNHKQGFSKDDPNGKYYKKQVTCKIQDPSGKWQDSIVYYAVSSGIPKGKKASSMAGLLSMLKVKLQPKMTDLQTARLFIKAMVKLDGPMLIADCDWSAWDKNAESRGDFGAPLRIGMTNFPKKVDGTYEHIIHTKKGEEVVAKLKILKWYSPVATATASAGATVAKPVAVVVKPVEVQPIPDTVEFGDDGEVVLDL